MGCRIIEDPENGAVFYCSTTGVAFGPVMGNREAAELFLKVIGNEDPRNLGHSELMDKYAAFVQRYVCECGALRDEFDAEVKASAAYPAGCTCDDAGECAWCILKQVALTVDDSAGERFACYQCKRKAEKKKTAVRDAIRKSRAEVPPIRNFVDEVVSPFFTGNTITDLNKQVEEITKRSPEPDLERDRR